MAAGRLDGGLTVRGATMQQSVRRNLRRRAHKVTQRLHEAYGSPRHGNKDDPLDELIFIILSQMTTQPSFDRVFDRLKRTCGDWDGALRMRMRELKRVIKDAGLSNQKAPRIKAILRRLERDFGHVGLECLRTMSAGDAEEYLTSLPGVGTKTAKCVLMYSLGTEVLPVDTHVWRVARRLGLIPARVTYATVHPRLEEAVAPGDRYAFHVNAVAHGRAACLAKRPRCSGCPVKRSCRYPTARRDSL